MRIGGCQIPVTRDIKKNAEEIKKAIDWAAENKVEMLLTPEGSVSGYLWLPTGPMDTGLVVLAKELKSISSYAKEKNVDLALGTGISERDIETKQLEWFNQLRFYVQGEVIHKHNKMYITQDEPYRPGKELKTFMYKGVKCAGLVCNDLWVCGFQRPGDAGILAKQLADEKVQLIFVAANAPRIDHDQDYYYRWNEIHIESYARQGNYTIVCADNCYAQNGEEYRNKTGVPSGIFHGGPEGKGWVVKTLDRDTQYFYYDLNFEETP
jgi:predicted amidohydrolase